MSNEIDHSSYPAQLRHKSDSSLRFIIEDCRAALEANPSTPKAGYYADEINYCANELNRRSQTGNGRN